MRKQIAILTAGLLAAGSFAGAQVEVLLDDFETEVAGWALSAGYPTIHRITDDGADGTSASMELRDGGYSKGVAKTYEDVVPADGFYRVSFWYKNGHANDPWDDLTVRIDGSHAVVLGSGVVTDWTEAETGVIFLEENDSFQVEIVGRYINAAGSFYCRFDEIYLVEADIVPIEGRVVPPNGLIVADTLNVEVIPTGGSQNFVKAEFFVDGVLAHTNDTPGATFTWAFDTTAEADGTVDITVVVTDDEDMTGEMELSYIIDNEKGRTGNLVENGDFETWSGGLPTGWAEVNLHADGTEGTTTPYTITQETEIVFSGSSALRIEYSETPDPYRYTLLSSAFPADRYDYQIWMAVRGSSFTRLFYFLTEDGETWVSTWNSAAPGPSAGAWTEYVAAPYNLGEESRPESLAVATHFFNAGTGYWDAIHVAASVEEWEEPVPTDARNWDLYQ